MKKFVVFSVILSMLFTLEIVSLTSNFKEDIRNSDEAISAKYDDSAPQARETEGKKRKNVFGKIALWTLHAAAIGGAVWYFFINPKSPLKKKENPPPPPPIEKGSYTSVSIRIKLLCKGFNVSSQEFSVKGGIYCGINKEFVPELSKELYRIEDLPGENPDCGQAKVIFDAQKDLVFNANKFAIFFTFNGEQINKNYKYFFCQEFSLIPVAYTYEKGKTDPGMPILLGVEDLIVEKHHYPIGPNGKEFFSDYTSTKSIFIVKPDQTMLLE